jgi:GNAT superfamily N-acetyltransferase
VVGDAKFDDRGPQYPAGGWSILWPGVTNLGEITLNYVSPSARFRGVSRALLAALEARAAERGNTICRLASTETAHAFYIKNGYVDEAPATRKFGMNAGYPMSKRIAR